MALFPKKEKSLDEQSEALREKSHDLQEDKLKLQRKQEVKNEKLTRQQTKESNFLEDQQAHGSLGDTIEDGAITMGQKLGLSEKTTTGFAMGAQDAKVDLFSSNEAIVEYYKNYNSHRKEKQQQVASVYSREQRQDQTEEKLKLSEKQSKATYKENKRELENSIKSDDVSAELQKAKNRADKAKSELNIPDISSTLKDWLTLE